MLAFLLQILKVVWRARINQFWPIWALMTGAVMVEVAWVVGHATTRMVESGQEAAVARARRFTCSGGAVAALTSVVLLLGGYIVAAVKWEDFADYDDAYFTLFTLRGYNLAPSIWRENGRFFPLGQQEFNLIRHFTRSILGYHAIPIGQLLVVCCILLFLDDELSITVRAALTALVLILPSTVTSFTGLVFPDRNVVFWLVLLVFFVQRFERTQATAWAVAVAICAQFMIYYKETGFLLLLGFAAGRLILRCRRPDAEGWDRGRLRDKESRLDLSLISLALLFLFYYAAAMTPHVNMQYADQMRVPLGEVLLYYLRLDLLAWLFVALALGRAYLILRRRVAPWPLWDSLALGGVACFAAYLYLRLCTPYYLAPVDLIAVIYVGRFVALCWANMRLWNQAAALVLACAVILQGASLSAFRLFERKNVIHAKVELASAIAARSQSDESHVQRLFFPSADVYSITEFASYLIYRGVGVEGESTAATAVPRRVSIVSETFTTDKPCVYYRNFICRAGSGPSPGDLVIELPDDIQSRPEINSYEKGGDLLLAYEPRPRIPQWMYPWLNYLRVASVRFRFRQLPDRWLYASVTRWK